MTPLQKYQHLLSEPGFQADPAQRRAIELLEALFMVLAARKPRASGLFGWVVRRDPEPIKGIYLWGGGWGGVKPC